VQQEVLHFLVAPENSAKITFLRIRSIRGHLEAVQIVIPNHIVSAVEVVFLDTADESSRFACMDGVVIFSHTEKESSLQCLCTNWASCEMTNSLGSDIHRALHPNPR
jgi:hypothetical protein